MSATLLPTLNLVVGGMVFLLGLVILRENPWQRLNRVVSFMLFWAGLGSILVALGMLASQGDPRAGAPPGFVEDFSYLWEFFFPTLFLFASFFPRERPFTRKFKNFEILVLAPHAFHFLLLLTITLIGPSLQVSKLDIPSSLGPLLKLVELLLAFFLAVHRSLFSLVNLGYGVAGVVLLLVAYRKAGVPRLRQQLRVIGFGLTICLGLYSIASSIPGLLNLTVEPRMRAMLTISALTVGSGAIAFSMVRYKFLDTKLLARRGILYALASALMVGIYLVVVMRLNSLLAGVTNVDARVFEPVFLVIGLILFQPAIARLEERLEQFFLRDPTDYRNVLRNLARELLTSIDLQEMLSYSIRTVADTLLLRSASVVALAREGPLAHVGSGPTPQRSDLALLAGVLARLSPDRESYRLEDPSEGIQDEDRAFLSSAFQATLVFPLRSKGETVGALLLGDKLTGTEYTSEDVALLSDLARQMSVSLQNGLLLRERVAGARLEEELNLARKIQSTFLPSEFPTLERLQVYGVNTPSRQVGGDYYDLVPNRDGSLFLAIADVSGKGVPAALLTSMLQASLRTQAESKDSVSAILHNMNSLVHSRTTDEQFATFFLAHVDQNTMRMSFSNAGHNYPLVFRRRNDPVLLSRGGVMLGMFDQAVFEEDALHLEAGDRVVLYTDGVSEALNRDGEEYGEERLERLVAGLPGDLSARQMTDRILGDLYGFLDGLEPQDDVTVMVVRVLEAPEAPRLPDERSVASETRSPAGSP